MHHRIIGSLLCCALLASPALADKEKARAHFRKGMASYMLDRFEQAIPEFEAGFAEEPEAAFLYNLAQAHARLGHHQQAINFYRKYLDMGAPPEDVAAVQKRIEELEALVSHPQPVVQPIPDSKPIEPPPPPVVQPVKDSTPTAQPATPGLDLTAPPPTRSKTIPIAIGVAAAVVVVAVVIGLAVGLSQHPESSFLFDAR
jgi:hypothetical protein